MAISFMMLYSFIAAPCFVNADVRRDDGYHNYEEQFTVEHKGRMLGVLMYFNNVQPESCALHCVRHLRCKTINYHHVKKACELTDEDFNEIDAETISSGWYNYGTPSKVDGGWSSWKNLTDCTKTCESGTLEQWRECDSPKPDHGGADCKGRMRRTVKCNTEECPVDGGWSSWKKLTDCTKTCGTGTLEQWRECDSPKPDHGGTDCKGIMRRTVDCNTHKCPVVNIALKKKSKQSSTHQSWYAPSKAVDGNTATTALTSYEANQWWLVDLGEVRAIKYIILNAPSSVDHPRNNKGLRVETRKEETGPWTLCYDIGDIKETVMKITCKVQSTKAQFLRIISTKTCHLNIREVEIFG